MYTSNKTKNGNVGVSYKSQEEADAQAAQMDDLGHIDCTNCESGAENKNCTNCFDCKNCSDCINCSYSNSCTDCDSCKGCVDQKGKSGLIDIIN